MIETAETTKTDVAKAYLNLLDKEKEGSTVALGAEWNVNLNPYQDDAVDYLIGEKDDMWSKNILSMVQDKVMERIIGGKDAIDLEYNKLDLQEMKEVIQAAGDDQTKLNELLAKIEKGIKPKKDNAEENISTEEKDEEGNDEITTKKKKTVVVWEYDNLEAGDVVTEEEIEYVKENAKSIVEDLEVKWALSKIDKVKDKEGNVILKCAWTTPYINSEVAADLVWLALVFYKKTGKAFTLTSTYRTIAHQTALKIKNKATWVPTADPGYSGHNLWYSLDITDDTRYDKTIGWVAGLKKIAAMFDFHPISSEDRHFDHSLFVDKYYKDKAARLPIAQSIDKEFTAEDEDLKQAA